MLDGGMACSVCVASDPQVTHVSIQAQGDSPDTVVATTTGFSTFLDFDKMTADEWKHALANRDKIGLNKFMPYHYMLGNGQQAILSPEAADDFEDWIAIGGCTCFMGHAPCSSCTHPGHPISLENRDDCVVFPK